MNQIALADRVFANNDSIASKLGVEFVEIPEVLNRDSRYVHVTSESANRKVIKINCASQLGVSLGFAGQQEGLGRTGRPRDALA
ncbi:MAG: hypothetical protein U0228_00040 [Myxococcaceae bacterium]